VDLPVVAVVGHAGLDRDRLAAEQEVDDDVDRVVRLVAALRDRHLDVRHRREVVRVCEHLVGEGGVVAARGVGVAQRRFGVARGERGEVRLGDAHGAAGAIAAAARGTGDAAADEPDEQQGSAARGEDGAGDLAGHAVSIRSRPVWGWAPLASMGRGAHHGGGRRFRAPDPLEGPRLVGFGVQHPEQAGKKLVIGGELLESEAAASTPVTFYC
jgi:hypothetical protein